MSDRAKDLMKKIWDSRNSGVDTEEKLVAEMLRLMLEHVSIYSTQNEKTVITTDDILSLSNELEQLK